MIIRQTPNERISPVFQLQTEVVTTNPGSTAVQQHRAVNYLLATGATFHNEYVAQGADLPVSVATQSPAASVDISEWPRIKRQSGVNSVVNATFSNSRATTSSWRLDFRTTAGGSRKLPAQSAVADTYFAYSYAAVKALADEMTTNRMWDNSGNRAQTGVIPHQAFTGQVWNGGWGIPGVGTNGGRRFMAITPRHLFACGHYQYYPGEKLYWKDVNNNVIERTVLRVVNVSSEMAAAGQPAYDMSIALLSADLPGSITILPVVGDWARGIVSVNSGSFTRCLQAWGFVLFNNDGHLNPFCAAELEDTVIQRQASTYEGISLDAYRVQGLVGPPAVNGMEDWNPGEGSKFQHVTRGGDSGSPAVIPVAGGWAFCGHVSTNRQPNPELFDELIDLIDSRAVAAGELTTPTGHTVAVAPDPTA